ncbi:MAG: hypothetical protein WBJ10_02060 [Daejeonella sp.]|uniref:hypothetical protein n=1 Tax=Daejeonella sp. TaxID=2805397 RepID=UPI003C70C984
MKLTKLLFPLITFIVIITSCGKDDLPAADGGLTAKSSMLASHNSNSGGNTNTGGTTTTNGSDKTKLEVPVVSAVPNGTTVLVSWNAIPNAIEYHVVFEGTNAPSSQKVTGTSVTVSSVTAGNYNVKVSALAENSSTSMFIDSGFGASTAFSVGNVAAAIKLATPQLTLGQISYNSGKGNTSVSWGAVTHATGYSVTVNDVLVSDITSPLSLPNLEPGTYVVGVRALSTNTSYSTSDEGTVSITIKARNPISTPVISGNVTYTTPSAGTVSVTPLFIWPPNNKLTTVTFVGSGLSTGTGSISASHNTVANATDYNASPLTLSNLGPGNYTFSVTAIAGGTYFDDNWVNSAVGNSTFTVAPGSLKGKLVDEYGVYTKEYVLTSSFTLPLQLMASRLGTDKTGRDYTFTISATNGGGATVTGASAVSNVPHDQR